MWRPALTPEEQRHVARVRRLLVDDARTVVTPVPADCAGEWIIALEQSITSSSDAVVLNLEIDAAGAAGRLATALAAEIPEGEAGLAQARTVPVVVLVRGGAVPPFTMDSLATELACWLRPWHAELDAGCGVRVLLEVTSQGRIARTLPEPVEALEYPRPDLDRLEADVMEEVERVIRFEEAGAVEFAALRLLDLSGERPGDLGILVSTFADLDAARQQQLVASGWANGACASAVESRRAELSDLRGGERSVDPLNLTREQTALLSSVGGLCELDGCPLPTPRTMEALGQQPRVIGRDRTGERALVACFQLERRLRAVIERERNRPRGESRLARALDAPWSTSNPATVRLEIQRHAPTDMADRGELDVATFGQLLRVAEGMLRIPNDLYRSLRAAVRLRNDLAHQRGIDLATFTSLRAAEAQAKREIGHLQPRG